MENDQARYFDFSTEADDLDALSPGYLTGTELGDYAKELQRYAVYRNPIVSIRQILAMHAATVCGIAIGAKKSRHLTNILLSVIAVLLAYIAYALA